MNKIFKVKFLQNGFTILYAVLISAMLLSIGVSIYNVSYKQYVLASSAADSALAIYAADGGMECATYWDLQAEDANNVQGEVFGSPTNSSDNRDINCNGEDVPTYTLRTQDNTVVLTSFTTNSNGPSSTCDPGLPCLDMQCADIVITKEFMVGSTVDVKTTIESKGHNYCSTGNPRRVERALRVSYPIDPNSGIAL